MASSENRFSSPVRHDGFSNMSLDYPILINGARIQSCEHLFHALKFPDHPQLQQSIISTSMPSKARTLSSKECNKTKVRSDWKDIQIEAMYFCLRAKLIWNWVSFGRLLGEASDLQILEASSRRDGFWGVASKNGKIVGHNHLGTLLIRLRDEYLGDGNESLRLLHAPENLALNFLGRDIQDIDRRGHLIRQGTKKTASVDAIRPISLTK